MLMSVEQQMIEKSTDLMESLDNCKAFIMAIVFPVSVAVPHLAVFLLKNSRHTSYTHTWARFFHEQLPKTTILDKPLIANIMRVDSD